MKKIALLFCALTFLLSACSEKPGHENVSAKQNALKSDSVKSIIMSRETSIGSAEYLTAEIKIPTAVCGMCEKNISKAVKKIDGVVEAKIDAELKIAKIKFDGGKTTTSEIKTAISNSGYDADDVIRKQSAYDKLDECCKIENKKHI